MAERVSSSGRTAAASPAPSMSTAMPPPSAHQALVPAENMANKVVFGDIPRTTANGKVEFNSALGCTAGVLKFWTHCKNIMFAVTSACTRRTASGVAARVERRQRER
jgi:hypothetical protein